MKIRIAHASDTHARPSIVRQVAGMSADLLTLTGDIFGNKGWVPNYGIYGCDKVISPAHERKYQRNWFRDHAKKWAGDLNGCPVLYIGGNHDFYSPTEFLRHYGVTVYEITDDQPMVEVLGIRFAGFRQINPIVQGDKSSHHWAGETDDLMPHIERAFACDPQVLITHGPPRGILDSEPGYGMQPLADALFTREHRITHHFFGHSHPDGGQQAEERGIKFYNGAGHCLLHEVDL